MLYSISLTILFAHCRESVVDHRHVSLVSVIFVSIIHLTWIQITKYLVRKCLKMSDLEIFLCTTMKPGHCATCLNLRQLFALYSYSAE